MNDPVNAYGGKTDSSNSMHRLLMRLPIAVSHIDREGRVLTVNDRFVEIFGYTPDDIHTIEEWWPRAYPDPVRRQQAIDTWTDAVSRSVSNGTDIPALTYEITCKDGSVRQIEVSGLVLEDGLVATFVDVTARKHADDVQRQLNRELRAISQCNQALMRAEDEQALLDEITRIIVEEAGYRVAFVAYAEHDAEQTVRPVAWAGMNEDYFAGAKLTWADRDLGQGPIGTAIRTGQIVEIHDIASEPRMLPWREKALARGYRSGVALPLKDDQQAILGGLLIYAGEANAITAEEVRLLDELAGDLAFGITNLRARDAHRQAMAKLAASEQLFRALVENSPDPIARYDRDLRRIYINPAIRKLFNKPAELVLGRTPAVASPLVDPESYMAAIRRVIETRQDQTHEGAARAVDGGIRWSSWRFTPEFGPDGEVVSVLVISHDITDRKRAEDERQTHLGFLESLDRINRVIQGAGDLDAMMGDVLDAALEIFDCDRAFLLHPCDPDAAYWHVPMERTRPDYPGVLALGLDMPMDADVANTLRTLLDAPGPILFGPGMEQPLPDSASRQFGIKSILSMAIRPLTGKPWQFGLHQCSRVRQWTAQEVRLFEEIGRRLSDGLNNLLITRNLRESEESYRLVFENSPLPIHEGDFSAVKRRLDELRTAFGDDIDGYFHTNPEIVTECAKMIRLVDLNRAALQLHSAKEKEAILSNLLQIFAPESLISVHQVLAELARGKTDIRLEGELRTLDGRRQIVSAYFTVCPGYEQTLGKVLVSLVDITERKHAERERHSHVNFLVSLDRINRAIQGATNLDRMMGDVLDTVLEIFGCDRAYLHYPCDPDAGKFRIPMERCNPAYPSVLKPGEAMAIDDHIADTLRALQATDHPIQLGPGTDRPIPEATTNHLGVRSMMAMVLRPLSDRPWQFGIHQCSHARTWTEPEVRLFEEIGRRISDALNSLLVTRSLRESEQLFRALAENSPDVIVRYDRECRRIYVNPEFERVNNLTPQQVLGTRPLELSTELAPLAGMFTQKLKAVMDGGIPSQIDLTYEKDGKPVCWFVRAVPEYGPRGEVVSALTIWTDITERKRSEERLRLAASVFATSQEGILISDADNRIIDVNPAFTRLTGYAREEVLGRDPSFLSATRQDQEVFVAMRQALETTGEWQGELWNQRKSGDVFAELLSVVAVKDMEGHLQHHVSVFSDISMIKAHEADLDRIAHYDTLTGVPNRRLLGDRLEQAIARARRHGSNMAVCYLDLDGFKPINDQFGHEGGDRLLVEIARRLQSLSRADDTVARLGGDEFVLLWNDIGAEAHCTHALDRVLAEVSAPIVLDGIPVAVSASIGVTLFPDDNVDADSLLRHADHAMYSAKQLGKNRYQLFDSRLEQQITSRVSFLAKVGRGLDRGEFMLYYQPKYDCAAGRVIGVEALVRWNEPILGVLSPREFLPLIEDDNLAFRMGRWVMEESIRQARRWHEMGLDLAISINIFPRHLKYPTFIEDLRNAIATHWPDMPKDRLMLEIVETSELEELDPIEDVIRQCLKMGIASSLDDFGTGYSSLIYLRRLSVEELKIDQSFVRDMLDDPEDNAIVVGVIGLGKAFGLRVVAEGVESQRHARRLIELGCSIVQGYGVGMPMPADEFEQWLAGFASHGERLCK
jgi:diguanylate cyclase (GGDEF)-like protein/PAS domain S-box-containing protein